MTTQLLSVDGLNVSFGRDQQTPIPAVRDVTFSVAKGECVVVLGESGSGKSVTAQSILGLHDPRTTAVTANRLHLGDEDLLSGDLNRVRGSRISMVFQDALSALNPVHRVGAQIAEALRVHRGMGRKEAGNTAVELMRAMQIPDPEQRAKNYPHQLSGGMRQRIMIAMALALEPELLIADEPTTALDVTVQLQILQLLRRMCAERDMALLMITHDVGVAAEMADRIVVMYAGKIVEVGSVHEVLGNPKHPYTRGLLGSVPRIDLTALPTPIPGGLPDPGRLPSGCVFAPRCPIATSLCEAEQPPMQHGATGRELACHLEHVDETDGASS
ncbi:ABC transporter ATP-binding protein [Leucobacter sp. NPDC015123]|uniref:ABC transporter ATP-binding protein n=1 Tax=Leucobacter sp. NPDC015123 TaxID=3364129 RepID=UPI0036F46B36